MPASRARSRPPRVGGCGRNVTVPGTGQVRTGQVAARAAGPALDQPGPIALDEPAVCVQLAARAEVLDDVPVHGADVRAAGERVRVADREVHGAVDLLVEAD